jgi:membrane-associated phospholipid phosphatase
MRQRIFRVNLALFVVLYGLMTGSDVRAGDRTEAVGNVLAATLPAAAAGLSFSYKDGPGALEFGESAALAMGVTLTLKAVVDKTRPNGKTHSFPSGHATISATSAEFMYKRYGWEYGVPAYALASFVAYSRVEAGQHYTIDVISGAVIGIASSFLLTHPYRGWHVQPEAGHSYLGISLSRSW